MDPPERWVRKALVAGAAAIVLGACSSAPTSTSIPHADNVKPLSDNDSFLKTPAPQATGKARPLPTADSGKRTPTAEPAPEVTVTVTAQPTMNQATDQPALLRIPSFDVTSEVVSVGLDSAGGVVVPDDISVTGWYDRSSWIGAPFGSIVLVGHRDSAVAGAGALYGIEELQVGESLVLTAQDGAPHRFRVREIKSVEKTRFSTIVEEVFGSDSPYRLTLITCGGAFDEAAGSYVSNIIVTAYPE